MSIPRTLPPFQMQLPIEDPSSVEEFVGTPVGRTSWSTTDARSRTVDFASIAMTEGIGDRERGAGTMVHVIPMRQLASNRQLGFLRALAAEAGFSAAELEDEIARRFGVPGSDGIDRRQAAILIRTLQERMEWPVAS